MYELVNRKKVFVVTINVFLLNLFGLCKRKGSVTTKAANKPEKTVATKEVVDKNDSVLKVVE